MALVDPSVWIEVFRQRAPLELESAVTLDEVVTCLPIHCNPDFAALAAVFQLRQRSP